jgi:hypothetical protein
MHIFAIARNPIERAYSSFMYLRSRGREPLASFEEALDAEVWRRKEGWAPMWHYYDAGFYSWRLRAFLREFEPSQVHVFSFDDLKERPQHVLESAHRTVIGEPYPGNVERFEPNASGTPRSKLMTALLFNNATRKLANRAPNDIVELGRRAHGRNLSGSDEIESGTRDRLRQGYDGEIDELSAILGRDLGHW